MARAPTAFVSNNKIRKQRCIEAKILVPMVKTAVYTIRLKDGIRKQKFIEARLVVSMVKKVVYTISLKSSNMTNTVHVEVQIMFTLTSNDVASK